MRNTFITGIIILRTEGRPATRIPGLYDLLKPILVLINQ
ncbi:hypothetical protein BBUCA112A_J0030 (plasmid) [Borreliella burgdorferi CA-11.2A]|nr:hypothetical protein BBUCA112A_J0030 [Borreliella burgdorferi CA-11.2A]